MALSARQHHRAAMMAYDAAESSLAKHGDTPAIRAKYHKAMLREATAAAMLAPQWDNEPARSVIHRSAATMAIKAGEFAEALRLIAVAREGRPYRETEVELAELAVQCEAAMQT